MRLDITGRHVDITASLRQLIARRLVEAGTPAQRQRHLGAGHPHQGEVPARHGDHRPRAGRPHVARPGRGHALDGLGARGRRQDRAAGAEAEGKVGHAETARRERSQPRAAAAVGSAPEQSRAPRIVRATRYAVKPMSLEDAALRRRIDRRRVRRVSQCRDRRGEHPLPPHRRKLRIDRAGLTVTAVEVAQERLR